MSVWFTSDLHLGHRHVAGIRGFADASEHDDKIAEEWTRVVRKGDDVWVLGDLCASSPRYALDVIATLPGRKHLISGNHDRCHPMHRDAHNHQGAYLEVFDSVQPFARRKVAGEDVLLSHFPYVRDREEPRHMQWRLPNDGAWLLHGHTHGTERLSYKMGSPTFGGLGWLVPPTREIHVGVDAWDLRPVSLEAITELMGDPTRPY